MPPSYPREALPPPFWQLLARDFNRTASQAFLIALLCTLMALLGLARDWLLSHIEARADNLLITVVLPDAIDETLAKAVADHLTARDEVLHLQRFGPEDARRRLEDLGLNLDELDAFALQNQPQGYEFRWAGIGVRPRAFLAFVRELADTHALEVHWDSEELEALIRDRTEVRDFLRRLQRWAALLVGLALAVIAVSVGRPEIGRTLTRGERIQALVVRAGAAGLAGWLVAGALLHLLAGRIGGWVWADDWWVQVWVVPVAMVLAPLGTLRGGPEVES